MRRAQLRSCAQRPSIPYLVRKAGGPLRRRAPASPSPVAPRRPASPAKPHPRVGREPPTTRFERSARGPHGTGTKTVANVEQIATILANGRIGRRPRPLVESPPIELEILSQAIRPARSVNAAPVDVTDLAYDARRVVPGALFVCVPGFRADGHDFASEAVERGAVALVVERELDLPVPQLVVGDARTAMGLAADAFFGRPTRELDVVGVTGTNGKTTTAFLLFAILAAAGRRPGLLGTVESRIGGERRAVTRTTPEAIDLQRTLREMVDAGDRSCAMEASSHASTLGRLAGTRFAALVFTNLSQDHLDFHGTMGAYFEAKRRLFTEPGPDGRRPRGRRQRPRSGRSSGSPASCGSSAPRCSRSASSTMRTFVPTSSRSGPPAPRSPRPGSSCGRGWSAGSTSRTRSGRWPPRACSGIDGRRHRNAESRTCRESRAASRRSTRASRSPFSSTTPTPRRRS